MNERGKEPSTPSILMPCNTIVTTNSSMNVNIRASISYKETFKVRRKKQGNQRARRWVSFALPVEEKLS